MTIEAHRPREQGPRQEDLAITPESLWVDNHSPLADERRAEFIELRNKGELIGVERCSDARLRPPSGTISIGSISAADIPNLNLIRHPGTKAWMSLTHFSSEELVAGKMPTGCGGLAAKKALGNGENNQYEGAQNYVVNKVKHPDPLIQSIWTAEAMSLESGKPALAATQDHLTGDIYPIALVQIEDGMIDTKKPVALSDTNILNYDETRIYADGIPVFKEGKLPDEFIELLKRNRREQQEVLMMYSNLRELQRVQKPRIGMITTDQGSLRPKLPMHSSIPGAIFKVHGNRTKVDGTRTVDDESMESIKKQINYPISNCLDNHGDPDKPFSNTDRLIVESGDLELSKSICQRLMEEDWMREWTKLEGRKIIVLQTVGGVISDYGWYTL